ncbi:hypothetical protein [Lewinella sp. LCG006]|uniref:hypothetical protein n=1 Tax=Lewinella sp. LCG006 TaxID=3231911 RepID=UPI00345F4741
MDILIIGEYSGFAKELKKGFDTLNHRACIVTSGDGYKEIPFDRDDIKFRKEKTFYINKSPIPLLLNIVAFCSNLVLNLRLIFRFKRYKLIIVINCEFLTVKMYRKVGVYFRILNLLLKDKGKMILSACGDDTAFYEFPSHMKFNPYANNQANYLPYVENKDYASLYHWTVKHSDLIVPIMYDYYAPSCSFVKEYKYNTPVTKPVFLPFSLPHLDSEMNYDSPLKKIIVFYGVPRANNKKRLKGSNYILEALDIIQKRFPNSVEVRVVTNLPFNEYMKQLQSSNIVLDQCFSHGLGVNAVMAMSFGKVVLGGNSEKNINVFELDSIPVIDIKPSVEQILHELESLIREPVKVGILGNQARKFAEKHFEPSLIASKYLDIVFNT